MSIEERGMKRPDTCSTMAGRPLLSWPSEPGQGGCCVEPIVSLSVWDIVSRARTTYFTSLFLKFRTSRSSFEQGINIESSTDVFHEPNPEEEVVGLLIHSAP